MTTPKIVDAVSVPVEKNNPAEGIKIDTSGLAKALQSILAENTPVQTTKINPADYIKESGTRMVELYSVYEKDRKSTRLNSSHVSESRMPSSA